MEEKIIQQYLNAYEVKKLLRIPLSTIYYLTQTSAIKSIRVGRHIRYKREDIEYYMNNGLGKGCLPLSVNLSCEGAAGSLPIIEKQKERRSYPRIKCETRCIVKVDLARLGDINIMGIVQDISASGLWLGVMQGKQIQTDYPVNVSFRLNEEEVELSGRVVRTDNNGIAVKYRNIPEEIKEKIIRYVG